LPTKKEIIRLLEERNYQALCEIERKGPSMIRTLISLTYDKEGLLSWRAVEAIGILSGVLAESDPSRARNLVQRLLWMMRDESGNNPWSVPEMLGEIVRNSPEEFSDMAPIIESFHDEEMLRCGVLRALARIAEVSPGLVASSSLLIERYLGDDNEAVRAHALLLAGKLGLKQHCALFESLVADRSVVRIYRDGELRILTVGQIAEETVILVREKGE